MRSDDLEKIRERIDALPSGGITLKKINGKEYEYYQWRENGKQRSRRIKGEELAQYTQLIEERKKLQAVLKEPGFDYEPEPSGLQGLSGTYGDSGYSFKTMVRIGETLSRFAEPVKTWKKRECYRELSDYIYGNISDKVFILYGLRRTGKTTLIRQLILDMDEEMREKTVFIQISERTGFADVNQDLKHLEKQGFRYVFIDEVTLLSDFIEGAALFSDIFAASGMKIVLSGTDSLGFLFTEDEQLYDRCILLHTTFIPYREFENVLGVQGIDQYIQYGGTMSMGGINYNEKKMTFATEKSTGDYVDSAIARNIQHSLRNYQYEGHFRDLWDLYRNNELTSVINRVVEDINHRFTMEVLTREFRSNDLRISANNLRRDREEPTDVLDRINTEEVTERLKHLLMIRDREEQSIPIKDANRREIKEYLGLLDLTAEIDEVSITDFNHRKKRTVFIQPGMRYSQAEALIKSLLQDNTFRDLSLTERTRVSDRILSEVKGRMMEDIVLYETREARPECLVFVLQFPVGEFDMVVFDPKEASCEIFEIKHSDLAVR